MSAPKIHPSAIVEDGAEIGDGCRIGPFCHVGPKVVLGVDCELVSHAVVAGDTRIGARTKIYPFASIGHPPQDLKYRGEPSTLRIGSDCLIRDDRPDRGNAMTISLAGGRGNLLGDNLLGGPSEVDPAALLPPQ